jgi:outer membrane receptor protein involved in Fe transport
METPFSVQVIPKEVIRDQQATRVEEALSNVSGVYTLGTDSRRDANFNIRGFGSRFGSLVPVLRDGYRQYGDFQGIPEAGEQIEVLKGPSSLLYGQIEPGGIINLVSKKPLSEPFYEIELQAGNRNFVSPRIDLNGPLTQDGDVLYRLSALYRREDSFRGFDAATNRFAIAPAVTWKISDRTKAEFSLEYTRIGILYQPIEELALFANYSQSFNPSTGTTVDVNSLPPERGQGFEVGIKTELFNKKLLATLTYFNITKNNVAVVDPNFPLFSTSVGQEKSQGFEFDVVGKILPGWKLIGSYAYTDAKISEDTNPDNIQ